MHIFISTLSRRLRLALVAIVVFALFASASVVLAESKQIPPCVYGNPNAFGQTALQFGEYQSHTDNNLSGCTHLFVRLHELLGTTITAEKYRDNNGAGATTGWTGIPAKPGYIYVARNSVQRRIEGQLPSPLVYVYTSDNGTHSSGSWYCSGTSGGTSNCAPAP